MTTAFLAASVILGKGFRNVVKPFDEILQYVQDGHADAGLIIHEGQLTYQSKASTAASTSANGGWKTQASLPRTSSAATSAPWNACSTSRAILKKSIQFSLDHRKEAVQYASNTAATSTQHPRRRIRRHVRPTNGPSTTAPSAARPSTNSRYRHDSQVHAGGVYWLTNGRSNKVLPKYYVLLLPIRLANKLHRRALWNHADGVAFVRGVGQRPGGRWAVVEGPFVDVHAHEFVGKGGVEVTAEFEGVLDAASLRWSSENWIDFFRMRVTASMCSMPRSRRMTLPPRGEGEACPFFHPPFAEVEAAGGGLAFGR